MTPVVGSLVTVGMLVVAPLGLARIGTPGLAPLRRAWVPCGLVAVVAMFLPRGVIPALLAAPYAALTLTATALGVRRALHWQRPRVQELTALTALGSLGIAGTSLVAERAGIHMLGYGMATLALTVAHFHFAGFAAALLAGLVLERHPGPLATLGALAIPIGTVTTGIGFFVDDAMQAIGGTILTAGLLATGWVIIRQEHPVDRTTRTLLLITAYAVPFTMLLALWYAGGKTFGVVHPSVSLMAETHGVGNALAVGLASVVAWSRLRPSPL